MSSVGIIFPNQLFEKHELLEIGLPLFLIEHPRFFTDFAFHKSKLVLHRATMKAYQAYLQNSGHVVHYIDHNKVTSLAKLLKMKKVSSLHCYRPFDHELEKEIGQFRGETIFYESPLFLSDYQWLKGQCTGKKQYRLHTFYTAQRKRLAILVQHGKPIGGRWSFDKDNREKMPDSVVVPSVSKARTNAYVKEAVRYVQKHFKGNPGEITTIYPSTFSAARLWYESFLNDRFKNFGAYQDSMVQGEAFLFHSLLSPILNIGLLTPRYVVDRALEYAKIGGIPLNSLEGFIRQIIGWREFVAGMYQFQGKAQKRSNFFRLNKSIPPAFYQGSTGIMPVDDVIEKVLKNAYAHHIERLMILGNCMLLCRISPHEVYRWFMELFIDSYDWVMVPNVYGMSQYADGGIMVTKPYISGARYILSMSDYQEGEWSEIWTSLYWSFVTDYKGAIMTNYRLKPLLMYLGKMKKETLGMHKTRARNFLKNLS